MMQNTKKRHSVKERIYPYLLLLATILLIACFGISLIRRYRHAIFPPVKYIPETALIDSWMEILNSGNAEKSILFAKKLVDDDELELPDPDYLQLFRQMEWNSRPLTADFNSFDFLRWADAVWLRQQVINLTENQQDEPLPKLFEAVMQQVKYESDNQISHKTSPSCRMIWENKAANYADIARLLFGLAEQAGYEGMLVSLFSPEGDLRHNICEFRNAQGSSWVADIKFRILWRETSAEKLALDPTPAAGVWPEKIQTAIQNRVYLLPAEFADYRVYSQQLAALLEKELENPPRFARDPRRRIDNWIRLNHSDDAPPRCGYWQYPLRKTDENADFPPEWRLNHPMLAP